MKTRLLWLCLVTAPILAHGPAVRATDPATKLSAPADKAWPVAPGQADIGPFAYAYRKGAANNPIETRWLSPTPDMLCGLLWEERRAVRRIEVEFPSTPAGTVMGALPIRDMGLSLPDEADDLAAQPKALRL